MSDINSLFSSQSPAVEQVLSEIEATRRASLFPCFAWATVVSVASCLFTFLFTGIDTISVITVAAIICPVVFWCFISYYRDKLSAIYKADVLPNLVKAIGLDMGSEQGFQYETNCDVPVSNFRDCCLFPVHSDDYTEGEDLITGKIDKTDFKFCEASYQFETEDSDGDKSRHTVFEGLYFDADFNKFFQGVTLLCTVPLACVPKNFSKVELENVDFCKLFTVYSTDQVEARYILSTALQERLVNMVKTLKNASGEKKFSISFFNSRMLLLVSSGTNHFEASLFKKLKLERVRQDFQLIYTMADVINELNLNTRIWTKQ